MVTTLTEEFEGIIEERDDLILVGVHDWYTHEVLCGDGVAGRAGLRHVQDVGDTLLLRGYAVGLGYAVGVG